MRKSSLQSEKKEQTKKRVMVILLGLLLVGILVFSSIAYVFDYRQTGVSGATPVSEYGQKFTPVQTESAAYYQTKMGGEQRQFIRLPTQVSYVPVEMQAYNALPKIRDMQTLVIAMQPDSEFSQYIFELTSYAFADLYADTKQIIPAITVAAENITQFPVISCANQSFFNTVNVTGTIPIIQIQEGNVTSIYTEGANCLIIQGSDGEGIIAAVERFRYGLFGFDFTKDPETGK